MGCSGSSDRRGAGTDGGTDMEVVGRTDSAEYRRLGSTV